MTTHQGLMFMHLSTEILAPIAFFVLSGYIHGPADRTVEVPVGKGGRGSGRGDHFAAGQGERRFARAARGGPHVIDPGARPALTKTLLSETLGPEVAITFRPGTMVMTVDERILARSIARSGCAGSRSWPNAPTRPHANGSLTACAP